MRDLIQPALKIMARTGLFLSVVAWVVGQWWTVQLTAPFPTGRAITQVAFEATRQGWVLNHHDRIGYTSIQWRAFTLSIRHPLHFEQERFSECHFFKVGDDIRRGQVSFAGMTARPVWGTFRVGTFLAVRHWLIVTIFALFHGALKWVYRKRGREATSLSSIQNDGKPNEAHET